MEGQPWTVHADYFKHMFPSCHKCQNGHKDEEAMLVHLTVSHFQEEAVKAFGDGPNCQICNEILAPHKETYRQYHILSHMARHIEQFVPEQVKHFFKGAAEKDQDSCHQQNSSSEILYQNVSETASTSVTPSAQRHRHANAGAEEAKSQDGEATQDEYNESLQQFQAYFKSRYPSCKGCKRIPKRKRLWGLKRHLTRSHYSKEAMRLFGRGSICSVCHNFSVRVGGLKQERDEQIKSHMTSHLDQVISDEEGKELFQKNKFRARINSNAPAPDTRNPNRNLTFSRGISQPQGVEVYQDYSKESLNCQLHWKEFHAYFKSRYPSCKGCKKIPKGRKLWGLKRHLTRSRYSKEAMSLFGIGSTCSLCNNFSVRLCGPKQERDEQIKSHMMSHLDQFISDEKAKELFLRIKFEPYSKAPIPDSRNPDRDAVQSLSSASIVIPPWHKCETLFKLTFADCTMCQRADYKSSYDMVRHLFTVHFLECALKHFGNDDSSCQVCGKKRLATPKNRNRDAVDHFIMHHPDILLGHFESAETREALEEAFKNLHAKFQRNTLI